MRKTFCFLLVSITFIMLSGYNAYSRVSQETDSLDRKLYPVGFKKYTVHDYSRSYGSDYNFDNDISDAELGRPILIYMWFPLDSLKDSTHVMLHQYIFDDYERLTKEERQGEERQFISYFLGSGLSPEPVYDLLNLETRAYLADTQCDSTFPLIVVGQGYGFENPVSLYYLCELLAQQGYIVATCPLAGSSSPLVNLNLIDLETQVRDMEFIISHMNTIPQADIDNISLLGFDLGGMSSLILQMRNSRIKVFISLDSGIMFEHNTRLLKQSPYYQPEKLTIPLLHITRTSEENIEMGVIEDYSLFNSSPYADKTVLRVEGIRHIDFTSFPVLEKMITENRLIVPDSLDFKYTILYQSIINFLNAYINNDEKAFAYLRNLGENRDFQKNLFSYEFKPGAEAPPLESDLIRLLFKKGASKAIPIFYEMVKKYPDIAIFKELTLNRLGYEFLYRRREPGIAIEIFKFNVFLFPQSANGYDSLGEAFLVNENYNEALFNYQKSLELDPANKNAKEILKQLLEKN